VIKFERERIDIFFFNKDQDVVQSGHVFFFCLYPAGPDVVHHPSIVGALGTIAWLSLTYQWPAQKPPSIYFSFFSGVDIPSI